MGACIYFPCGRLLTAATATCVQAPGEAPHSTTTKPGRSRFWRLSISSNLKALRALWLQMYIYIILAFKNTESPNSLTMTSYLSFALSSSQHTTQTTPSILARHLNSIKLWPKAQNRDHTCKVIYHVLSLAQMWLNEFQWSKVSQTIWNIMGLVTTQYTLSSYCTHQ